MGRRMNLRPETALCANLEVRYGSVMELQCACSTRSRLQLRRTRGDLSSTLLRHRSARANQQTICGPQAAHVFPPIGCFDRRSGSDVRKQVERKTASAVEEREYGAWRLRLDTGFSTDWSIGQRSIVSAVRPSRRPRRLLRRFRRRTIRRSSLQSKVPSISRRGPSLDVVRRRRFPR